VTRVNGIVIPIVRWIGSRWYGPIGGRIRGTMPGPPDEAASVRVVVVGSGGRVLYERVEPTVSTHREAAGVLPALDGLELRS
jgi:hypothetical protein